MITMLLDTLAAVYDEPFSDSSALPTYRVCELARTQVTVALSGDGGDENFAGYRRYRLHAWESALRARLPLALRKPLFGLLGSIYPKADWAPRPLRAKTTLQALARDDVEAYFHTVSTTSAAMRQQLYSASFKRELQGYSALAVFRAHAKRAPTDQPLLLAQYLDLKTWLPGDILTKVDRASMAHSLEVRVPLLDHRLVEWASSLPPGVEAAEEAPASTFSRRRSNRICRTTCCTGPRWVSVCRWRHGCVARLRSVRATRCSPAPLAECGYFEPAALDRLVREHAAGRHDHSATLWSLLMLDAFLRRMQQPAAVAATRQAGAPRRAPREHRHERSRSGVGNGAGTLDRRRAANGRATEVAACAARRRRAVASGACRRDVRRDAAVLQRVANARSVCWSSPACIRMPRSRATACLSRSGCATSWIPGELPRLW